MKTRFIAMTLILMLASCSTPPKKSNKEEAEARWEQMRAKVKFQLAERNFDTGELEEAMKLSQEVLALHPKHLEAYMLLARIQLEKGQTAEAEGTLNAAAGLGQATPELDYLRGMLAERREKRADAVDCYKRAYDAKPNEPEYLLAYAESLIVLGKIEPAMDELAKRQHDFEQEIRVQLLLGQTLAMLGHEREAGDVYLTVVRLEPNQPLIREEAGLVLLASGRLNEAQLVLDPLLDSRNKKPSATLLQAWGKALLDGKDSKRAAVVLTQATSLYPQAGRLWILLSKAHLMNERPTLAREAARQACSLEPDSADARLLLAYCCLAAGDREGAAVAAQKIIAAKPDDAEALIILERAIQPSNSAKPASTVQ